MRSESSPSYQWSTPIGVVVIGWILVAAAVAWFWNANTASDRVFIGVVVLALIAATGYATLCRPRLRADTSGVAVRGLLGFRQWPWSQVTVTVRHHQRFGRTSEMLEFEVGSGQDADHLVVLTRIDLGEAPHDVAEALHSLRC